MKYVAKSKERNRMWAKGENMAATKPSSAQYSVKLFVYAAKGKQGRTLTWAGRSQHDTDPIMKVLGLFYYTGSRNIRVLQPER